MPGIQTYIDLYIFSPFGPTVWLCNRVFTKSNGKTHDTPIIPAIPPFIIFGSKLKVYRQKCYEIYMRKCNNKLFCLHANSTYANCLGLGVSAADVAFVVILDQDAVLEKKSIETFILRSSPMK